MTFPQSHSQEAVGRASLKVCAIGELMALIQDLLEGERGGVRGPTASKPHVMSSRKCHSQGWP